MQFIRFGGLSSVNHKKCYIREGRPYTFHQPPAKKGIYAFIWPYIEDFLWCWKVDTDKCTTDEEYTKKISTANRLWRKKFKYEGMIWTHFTDVVHHGRRKGDWVEIHTNYIEEALNKQKHLDAKGLLKDFRAFMIREDKLPIIVNPYKRGSVNRGFTVGRDHLEVFIERVN